MQKSSDKSIYVACDVPVVNKDHCDAVKTSDPHEPTSDEIGDVGFREVSRSRRKQRKIVYGNAKNLSCSFKGIAKLCHIHVWKIQPMTTSEEDIRTFLANSVSVEFDVMKLQAKGEYASFRVSILESYKEKLLSASFWPDGVAVRPFFFPRVRETNVSTANDNRLSTMASVDTVDTPEPVLVNSDSTSTVNPNSTVTKRTNTRATSGKLKPIKENVIS
jgi:hypothetical protein